MRTSASFWLLQQMSDLEFPRGQFRWLHTTVPQPHGQRHLLMLGNICVTINNARNPLLRRRRRSSAVRQIVRGFGAGACAEWRREMAKSRSFKELVQGQVKPDKKCAEALRREGVDAMLSGDIETGKTILRDYIKATVGFEKLGAATQTPRPKSVIRMFGPSGNPQAKNLFSVIGYLQKR